MKIVIAPDSFKENLTATEVAHAIALGVRDAMRDAETVEVPMADGGEGTVDALVSATGGRFVDRDVTAPLGDTVRARFGILGDQAPIRTEVRRQLVQRNRHRHKSDRLRRRV